MALTDLSELIARWTGQAEAYGRDGATVTGEKLLKRVAVELEEYIQRRVMTGEAANMSGYTEAHLRELCRADRIEGAELDEGGHWTIPLASVPMKPGPAASPADELADRRARRPA